MDLRCPTARSAYAAHRPAWLVRHIRRCTRRVAARAGVALLVLACGLAAAGCTNSPVQARWHAPEQSRLAQAAAIAAWQIQLDGRTDLSVAAGVFELDPFQTSAATIARLHASGQMAICHLMVGVAELDRPDAARYPPALLGRAASAVPSGVWLDVRAGDQLSAQLADRLWLCRAKGFDGVDADGVDGYLHDTGFPISQSAQLAFDALVIKLARKAHLAVGMRLLPSQASSLGPGLDFAVTVDCFSRSDCLAMTALSGAGKPVFDVEYANTDFCPLAQAYRISAIRKHPGLDAWRETC